MSYSLRAGSGRSVLILLASCMTYTIAVCSEKLLMMDRGTVRNMQSIIPKINLRNQCIQLVFIIRIPRICQLLTLLLCLPFTHYVTLRFPVLEDIQVSSGEAPTTDSNFEYITGCVEVFHGFTPSCYATNMTFCTQKSLTMICPSNSAIAATQHLRSRNCITKFLKNKSNIEVAVITSVIYRMVLTLNRTGGVGVD